MSFPGEFQISQLIQPLPLIVAVDIETNLTKPLMNNYGRFSCQWSSSSPLFLAIEDRQTDPQSEAETRWITRNVDPKLVLGVYVFRGAGSSFSDCNYKFFEAFLFVFSLALSWKTTLAFTSL